MNMRIAIAGGGGFAYILAREIAQTSNAVLVLSTRHHPEFQDLGVQVSIIDYADIEQLRYALRGIDLVISTVPGESQLNLINAARHSRVRTFVPSEFEGAVDHRPSSDDPLDRGSEAALRLLNERSRNERSKSSSSRHTLRYTVFSCGIFYERFQPGGLGTVLGIGAGANINNPGTYLLNVETATAEIVEHSPSGRPVVLTMTSLYDVARFVRAAVEIGPDRWPREFRMRGDQMSVMDVIGACSTAKTAVFQVTKHEYRNIQDQLDWSVGMGDADRWYYFQRLKATAEGRYNFGRANLNELVNQTDGVEVRPMGFREWAWRTWEQFRLHQQQQQQLQENQMGSASNVMQLG